MSEFGKANATGRSSSKWIAKEKETFGPPKGEPWVWEPAAMKCSPAWKAMGINTRRLIDFLEVEHRNHAGRENGNLMATYDQLVDFGLTRSEVNKAIDEAEFIGLIRCKRGGRWAGTNQPSIYHLTFYADKNGSPATNAWKGKTKEAIDVWKQDRAKLKRVRKARKKNLVLGTTSRTTVVQLSELRDAKPRREAK